MSDEEVPTTSGVIVNVTITVLGSTLSADAATSDTSVFVDDASEFDEIDGGTLNIAGAQYTYTVVDMTTGELALGAGLAAGASDGDRVDVWDVGAGAVAVDGEAQVALPGALANADTIRARILQSLIPLLAEGIREPGQGESVTMQQQRSEWVLIDVRDGRASIVNSHGQYDRMTVNFTVPDVTIWTSAGWGAWDEIEELVGSSIGIRATTAEIDLFQPGVYAITGSLAVSGIEDADADCSVQLVVTAGPASSPPPVTMFLGAGKRGGDAPNYASCSGTYYRAGVGDADEISAAVYVRNLDVVNVTGIFVRLSVQRII